MRIKKADLRAMAGVLYLAVAAYQCREPMRFERLSPNTQDAYLRMAKIALESKF